MAQYLVSQSTDLTKLKHSSLIAVDTETTGISEADRLFAISIATATDEYYFDDRIDPRAIEIAVGILNQGGITWVMQNAKFDMRMLSHAGVDVTKHNIIELTSAARLVRNDFLKYSLDEQGKRYGFIKGADVVKDALKKGNHYEIRTDFFGQESKHPRYDQVPVEIMAEYAIKDARITFDLYIGYMRRLTDEDITLLATESTLNQVCYRMERLGLKLDTQKVLEAMSHEQEIVEQAMDEYQELTGREFVNSGKSIQESITYRLPLTDKGNINADYDAITLAQKECGDIDRKVLDLVLKIRVHEKRISTYYKSYLSLKDRNDVIHPTMWQSGTRTGRFSYSDPNLQNIPDEGDEFTHHIRECFIPRVGRRFVSLDYSQMEYRLAADYAGEKEVLAKIAEGADFHQAIADMVGIPRKEAKTLNFAVLYGAGIDKIAGMIGVTSTQAKKLKEKYFMGLPRIEQLIDGVIRTGKSRGHIFNWVGRKLYADSEFAYALPNHLIQSSGADVVKRAMVQIGTDPELSKLWCVLQVHDQLVFELTEDEMRYVPRIKEIMESVYQSRNGVKLTVDISVSTKSLAKKDMVDYEP